MGRAGSGSTGIGGSRTSGGSGGFRSRGSNATGVNSSGASSNSDNHNLTIADSHFIAKIVYIIIMFIVNHPILCLVVGVPQILIGLIYLFSSFFIIEEWYIVVRLVGTGIPLIAMALWRIPYKYGNKYEILEEEFLDRLYIIAEDLDDIEEDICADNESDSSITLQTIDLSSAVE